MARQGSRPMIDSGIGHVVDRMTSVVGAGNDALFRHESDQRVLGSYGTGISEQDKDFKDKYAYDESMNMTGANGSGPNVKIKGTTFVPRADDYRGPKHGHVLPGATYTMDPKTEQQILVEVHQPISVQGGIPKEAAAAAETKKLGTADSKQGQGLTGTSPGQFRTTLSPRLRPKARKLRRVGQTNTSERENDPMRTLLGASAPAQAAAPAPGAPAGTMELLLQQMASTPEGRARLAYLAGGAFQLPPEDGTPVAPPPEPAIPDAPLSMRAVERLEVAPPRALAAAPKAAPAPAAASIPIEMEVRGQGRIRCKVVDLSIYPGILVLAVDPENCFSPPSGAWVSIRQLNKQPDDPAYEYADLAFPGIEFQPKGSAAQYQVYLTDMSQPQE